MADPNPPQPQPQPPPLSRPLEASQNRPSNMPEPSMQFYWSSPAPPPPSYPQPNPYIGQAYQPNGQAYPPNGPGTAPPVNLGTYGTVPQQLQQHPHAPMPPVYPWQLPQPPQCPLFSGQSYPPPMPQDQYSPQRFSGQLRPEAPSFTYPEASRTDGRTLPEVMEPPAQNTAPMYGFYRTSVPAHVSTSPHAPHTPPLQAYDYNGYGVFGGIRSMPLPSAPISAQPIQTQSVATQTDRPIPPQQPVIPNSAFSPVRHGSLGGPRGGTRESMSNAPYEASPRRRPSYDRRQQYRSSMAGMGSRTENNGPNQRTRSTSPTERTSLRRSYDRYAEDLRNGNLSPEEQARITQRRRQQVVAVSVSRRFNDPNIPTPSQMEELRQKLRHFLPRDLPKGASPSCEICQRDYHPGPDFAPPSEDREIAIQLPCEAKHIFGEHCINTWFETCKKYKNKITCPMCREQLIKPMTLPEELLRLEGMSRMSAEMMARQMQAAGMTMAEVQQRIAGMTRMQNQEVRRQGPVAGVQAAQS